MCLVQINQMHYLLVSDLFQNCTCICKYSIDLQNLRIGGSSDSADGDTIGPLPYNSSPWSHSSHSDERSFPPPYEKGSPSLYKSSSPEGHHNQYKGEVWF